MRILWLSKRVASRHDFILERFGRLWELPAGLSALGHTVVGIAADYHRCEKEPTNREFSPSLRWLSRRVQPLNPYSWMQHHRACWQLAEDLQPQLIFAGSDAFHLQLGYQIAKVMKCSLWLDFYDNYESFGGSRLPGQKAGMRRAAALAQGISCVSEPLKHFIAQKYRLERSPILLENGASSIFFEPPSKLKSREALDLPRNALLIGTAGALDESRGLSTLVAAFQQLKYRIADRPVHLVLAGRGDLNPHGRDGIIFLDELPHAKMPAFWSALDVGVIAVRDDAFGRYCFPLKLAEAAAVRTPLVCARVGALKELFGENNYLTYEPESIRSLEVALLGQIRTPEKPDWQPKSWVRLSAELSDIFENLPCG